jgi:hypothetical protein
MTNIPSASLRPDDKGTPYHWLDFTPPRPQIAAAPVAYYSTAAHTLATLRQQRFEQRLFLIAEIKSHDPPPRTVNHVRPNYSMNYLGTDPNMLAYSPGRSSLV